VIVFAPFSAVFPKFLKFRRVSPFPRQFLLSMPGNMIIHDRPASANVWLVELGDTGMSAQHIQANKVGWLEKLKEYKELIGIIIFSIGGILWIVAYFATKDQINTLNCLLNRNIEVVQYQIDQRILSDDMRVLEFDISHLSLQQQRSLPEEQQLQEVNNKQKLALEKYADDDKRIKEARGIINRNECEKKSEDRPLIKNPE
jgi:hypothetical protein